MKTKTTLIILITFVIGIVTGALGYRAYTQYRFRAFMERRAPHRIMEHFKRMINPTEEQQKLVQPILDKYGKSFHDIHMTLRKKITDNINAMKQELRHILSPEQFRHFEEMVERPRRFSKGFGPPRPGGFPKPD